MAANTSVTALAATMQSPITFGSLTTTALVKAQLTVIINLLLEEEVDSTTRFLYLDQMTPAARASMVSLLTALNTATV